MAIVAVCVFAAGCRQRRQTDVVIASPHNKAIQDEFARAFNTWHRSHYGKDVEISWRDPGGGGVITQQIINQYGSGAGNSIDIYFGGGPSDHKVLKVAGILAPVKLPDDVQAQLPATISGVAQQDPEGCWHGAAVSAFGIFYNREFLKKYNLPEPKTWDDLAAPGMFDRVCAADATQSSSARAAYEMIVQSAGTWGEGWGKLIRIFGNCKSFTAGARDVIRDVSNGEVLAAAAIDFYGYDELAKRPEALGFTLVKGTTAFTPDPISLLKNAPHEEMAKRFIEFVFSREGQRLWCLPKGAEGGPTEQTLYRQPLRTDVYRDYAGKMAPPLVDVTSFSEGFKYNEPAADVRVGSLYAPLMKAAVLDNKDLLHRAWKAVLDAGCPADLVKEFTALPPELADEAAALKFAAGLSDAQKKDAAVGEWQRFFQDKYEGIIKKASGK
jgi:ABC-type Fe3+ transport system substrate-binding protein